MQGATQTEISAATRWLDQRPLDELLVTLVTTTEAILTNEPQKVAAGKLARDAMLNYLQDRDARRVPPAGYDALLTR